MKIYNNVFCSNSATTAQQEKCRIRLARQVATIGFFDGVHRGHQYLIGKVRALAKQSGMESMVITFGNHPRQVLDGNYHPHLLSNLDTKLRMLSETLVDNCVVLPFDKELASLSAHEFMGKILRDRLNVNKLVIGYDNHFGHGRGEGFSDYLCYGEELGMEVLRGEPFKLNDIMVSSSVIRSFISNGEIEQANECLGYAYTITGKVVKGFHEGRKMGFPTANISMEDSSIMVPANGVYAVLVHISQSDKSMPAMMNIGVRPTFGGNKQTLEVYILDFSGDLYDEIVKVSFVRRMRSERKFDSINELVCQLIKDKENVKEIFNKNKEI